MTKNTTEIEDQRENQGEPMSDNEQFGKKWRKGEMGVESIAQGWGTQEGALEAFWDETVGGSNLSWVPELADFLARQAISSSFRFKDLSVDQIERAAIEFLQASLDKLKETE